MMKRKVKTKKLVNLKVKCICCPLLKKQMPNIEDYIRGLIEAQDDFSKTKWAWGIVTTIRQIVDITSGKKKKPAICRICKEYTDSRRRLA